MKYTSIPANFRLEFGKIMLKNLHIHFMRKSSGINQRKTPYAENAYGQIQNRDIFCVPDTNASGSNPMNKYGQAEYAYGIMKQIIEKLLENKIITEEQFKQLDSKNKADCFDKFCTALAV